VPDIVGFTDVPDIVGAAKTWADFGGVILVEVGQWPAETVIE
jgi:hypothetical protein